MQAICETCSWWKREDHDKSIGICFLHSEPRAGFPVTPDSKAMAAVADGGSSAYGEFITEPEFSCNEHSLLTKAQPGAESR